MFFYVGQQGAAIRGIASLQCFLTSLKLPFLLVEPQVSHDVWGYTNYTDYMMLSDMFDLEDFAGHSDNVELVDKNGFVQNNPNRTVILFPGGTKPATLWSADSKEDCLEKHNLERILTENYGTMRKHMLGQFLETMSVRCVVRIVKLPVFGNSVRQAAEIRELIFGDWPPEDVTLMFQQWRSPYHISFSDTNETDCLKQYSMSEDQVLFKPSKRLLQDAQKYEEKFLGKGKRLTIMFRIERLVNYYLNQDGLPSDLNTAEECLHRVINLSNTLRNRTENSYPMVTMDVGTYGSATFQNLSKHLKRLTSETFSTLYRNNWSIESWERSFVEATGGVTNSAYIAALQRVLASRSDCLILLGGGNFQALAARDYERYHSDVTGKNAKCVHLVCTMTKRNNGLKQEMY